MYSALSIVLRLLFGGERGCAFIGKKLLRTECNNCFTLSCGMLDYLHYTVMQCGVILYMPPVPLNHSKRSNIL